ncbi:hypothetical protein ACLQ20_03785 [Micromonospora sp. DT46]|uniref:hypothetical protein n=1 Tax=unclassified Micromonospora TaxID=2617518 RepID=UPI00124B0118|nr:MULTISPECIES: hypothetical protein [unclassified Micromonospora]KAB1158446.1 hypothetical protein F6X68_10865 [Micromonospora sp. AMSO12t]WSG03952.1 hypothetical protein OG989_09760 [Micromonospora sp. NBC_01740]
MELGRALLLILAIVAMASLPALIALVFCADEIIDRVACGYAEWRERRRERRTIVRLDRAVEADALTRDIDLTAFDRPDRRPLEELAADLRRLRSQGVGSDGRQPVWHAMVLQAYDDRLRLACRALGLAEHLTELEGVDLELERVRVEGLLHAAGLTLPAARAGHWQRHR